MSGHCTTELGSLPAVSVTFPDRIKIITQKVIDYCTSRLGFLPTVFVALSSLTVISTYIIAVSYGHVYPLLPTISYTGIKEPEKNIFTLFMGISSFLGAMVVIVRYKQIKFISEYNVQEPNRLSLINKIGVVLGLLSFFGGAIVASFQADGMSSHGHIGGAGMVFIGGIVYFWIHTYFSFRMKGVGVNSVGLCRRRFSLSLLGTIIFVVCVLAKFIAKRKWRQHKPRHEMRQWQPGDTGFSWHVTSSFAEWITFAIFLMYFCSFRAEFEKISLHLKVNLRDNFETIQDERTPLLA